MLFSLKNPIISLLPQICGSHKASLSLKFIDLNPSEMKQKDLFDSFDGSGR